MTIPDKRVSPLPVTPETWETGDRLAARGGDPGRDPDPLERSGEMTPTSTAPKAPSADGPAAASISAFGKARSTIGGSPLAADEARKLDAFWRACNYLALGMTYLKANPLLKEPLKPEHVKDRLLGHW